MKPFSTLPLIAPIAEACMRFLATITGHNQPNKNANPPGPNCPLRKHPVLKNNFTATYNDILIRTSKSI